MTSNPTLLFLEQIRNNLESVDYGLIYQSIADMRDKFVPTAILHKGHYIERALINPPGEIFTNHERISYIHDKNKLKKVLFGRANEPKQTVFYGSIISPLINMPRVVAWFETTEKFNEEYKYNDTIEIFTVGRWRILEDIEIMEMIFSDEALKVNEYNRIALANQLKNFQEHPLALFCEEQGNFFSNEYARKDIKKGENYKYKISAAYTNYIWRNSHLKGITYPSVSSDFQGQNIALLPEIVDKYLKLELVGMFKFERRNGINLPIENLKTASDLGRDQMNFNWIDYS